MGRHSRPGQTGATLDGMEAKTGTWAEAKFWEWLAMFKGELGSPLASNFLSVKYLQEAFQAGFEAGREAGE